MSADLGCGSGVSSRYLAQHGFCVVGVDLAESALVEAQTRSNRCRSPAFFCRGNVSDLGFLSVHATFALDMACFTHGETAAYVASLADHLAPGAASCFMPSSRFLAGRK